MNYINQTQIYLPYDLVRAEQVFPGTITTFMESPHNSYALKIDSNSEKNTNQIYNIKTNQGDFIKFTSPHSLIININNGQDNWQLISIEDLFDLINASNYPRINTRVALADDCKYPIIENPIGSISLYRPIEPLFNYYQDLCNAPPYWIGHLYINGIFDEEEPSILLEDPTVNLFKSQCPGKVRHWIEPDDQQDNLYHFKSHKTINNRSELANELRNLGLYDLNRCNYFIHRSYLFSDSSDRLSLLRGILDAGADIDLFTGIPSIRVYSPFFARDLKILVESLGGWVDIIDNLGLGYKVYIHMPVNKPPFLRQDKLQFISKEYQKNPILIVSMSKESLSDNIESYSFNSFNLSQDKINGYYFSLQGDYPSLIASRPW